MLLLFHIYMYNHKNYHINIIGLNVVVSVETKKYKIFIRYIFYSIFRPFMIP